MKNVILSFDLDVEDTLINDLINETFKRMGEKDYSFKQTYVQSLDDVEPSFAFKGKIGNVFLFLCEAKLCLIEYLHSFKDQPIPAVFNLARAGAEFWVTLVTETLENGSFLYEIQEVIGHQRELFISTMSAGLVGLMSDTPDFILDTDEYIKEVYPQLLKELEETIENSDDESEYKAEEWLWCLFAAPDKCIK